jgi:hypothetical protein
MKQILFVAILLIFGGRNAAAEDAPPDFSGCRPEAAWVVPLGDHNPILQSAPLPAPVAQRLADIGGRYVRGGVGYLLGDPCEALYGAIYRVSIKDGRQLFGIQLINVSQWGEYQYFLFDPKSDLLSPSNIRLNFINTGDRTPSKRQSAPTVSFADLYRDGHPQIVIEEHKRNGTAYSCLIRHYFEIGRDLSLERVFALETQSLKGDYGPREFVPFYKRHLTILNGYQLRIDTSLGPLDEPGPERPQGYAILASSGPGVPFHVISRHPIHADDDWALVETSRRTMTADGDDDRFLREGCPDC